MKRVLVAGVLGMAAGAACAGGYAGAVAGLTKLDTADCPVGIECDDSDSGAKIYGGIELTPGLSVELAYTDFGAMKLKDAANSRLKTTAFSVVAAMRGKITNDFTAVGRIGFGVVKAKGSNNSGSALEISKTLYLGLGAEYAVTPAIKVTATLDGVPVEYDGDSGKAFLFGLGAQYEF